MIKGTLHSWPQYKAASLQLLAVMEILLPSPERSLRDINGCLIQTNFHEQRTVCSVYLTTKMYKYLGTITRYILAVRARENTNAAFIGLRL